MGKLLNNWFDKNVMGSQERRDSSNTHSNNEFIKTEQSSNSKGNGNKEVKIETPADFPAAPPPATAKTRITIIGNEKVKDEKRTDYVDAVPAAVSDSVAKDIYCKLAEKQIVAELRAMGLERSPPPLPKNEPVSQVSVSLGPSAIHNVQSGPAYQGQLNTQHTKMESPPPPPRSPPPPPVTYGSGPYSWISDASEGEERRRRERSLKIGDPPAQVKATQVQDWVDSTTSSTSPGLLAANASYSTSTSSVPSPRLQPPSNSKSPPPATSTQPSTSTQVPKTMTVPLYQCPPAQEQFPMPAPWHMNGHDYWSQLPWQLELERTRFMMANDQRRTDTDWSNNQRPPDTDCSLCKRQFKTKGMLKQHLVKVHPEHKPFTCNKCPFRANEPQKVRRHAGCHVLNSKYECGLCTASFAQKFRRDRHRVEVHQKNGNVKKRRGEDLGGEAEPMNVDAESPNTKKQRSSAENEPGHMNSHGSAGGQGHMVNVGLENAIINPRPQQIPKRIYNCNYCSFRSYDEMDVVTHMRQSQPQNTAQAPCRIAELIGQNPNSCPVNRIPENRTQQQHIPGHSQHHGPPFGRVAEYSGPWRYDLDRSQQNPMPQQHGQYLGRTVENSDQGRCDLERSQQIPMPPQHGQLLGRIAENGRNQQYSFGVHHGLFSRIAENLRTQQQQNPWSMHHGPLFGRITENFGRHDFSGSQSQQNSFRPQQQGPPIGRMPENSDQQQQRPRDYERATATIPSNGKASNQADTMTQNQNRDRSKVTSPPNSGTGDYNNNEDSDDSDVIIIDVIERPKTQKAFVCTVCEGTFSRIGDLQTHMSADCGKLRPTRPKLSPSPHDLQIDLSPSTATSSLTSPGSSSVDLEPEVKIAPPVEPVTTSTQTQQVSGHRCPYCIFTAPVQSVLGSHIKRFHMMYYHIYLKMVQESDQLETGLDPN